MRGLSRSVIFKNTLVCHELPVHRRKKKKKKSLHVHRLLQQESLIVFSPPPPPLTPRRDRTRGPKFKLGMRNVKGWKGNFLLLVTYEREIPAAGNITYEIWIKSLLRVLVLFSGAKPDVGNLVLPRILKNSSLINEITNFTLTPGVRSHLSSALVLK